MSIAEETDHSSLRGASARDNESAFVLDDGDLDAHECLAQAVETDIVPRLLAASRASDTEPAGAIGDPGDLDRFCAILLGGTLEDSIDFVEDLVRRGQALDRIYLGQVAGAARRLGVLWEEDTISFAEVSMGLSRLHMLLRRLSPSFGKDRTAAGPTALLAVTPGETHALGIVITADFFARAGFATRVELAPTLDDLLDHLRDPELRLVGLSASASRFLPVMTETISALRRARADSPIAIMAGGAAFDRLEDRDAAARQVGADSIATDPEQAVQTARSLID
ncbi:MAG: cobalamin-dependent protein [Pseudomonadota bacterium]